MKFQNEELSEHIRHTHMLRIEGSRVWLFILKCTADRTGWRRPFGPGRLTNATPAHATRPLKITEVGTQSFSPLFWAIQSGSLNSAKAMLQELFLGFFWGARMEKLSHVELWRAFHSYSVSC